MTLPLFVRQVETIGDAYMVVGGIPTRVADHATRVVSQAIDMVRLAREVAHPITGDPVQVSDPRLRCHRLIT